ncbi:MAG: FAD-dependent oxidoreductase [Armatimonadota bacterium]
MEQYDLIVVGGGAGGTGAALTAARLGLRTLWVEKEPSLGGTGVHALVNCWQPGAGDSPLPREIAGRLLAQGHAILVGPALDTPDGRPIYRRKPTATYDDTLRRWDNKDAHLTAPALVYEPAIMSRLLEQLAHEASIELSLNTIFLEATTEPSSDGFRRIKSLVLHTPQGPTEVTATHFIDATADIAVARSAGCAHSLGREPQAAYGEPSAPEAATFQLNGCTLCFLCRSGADRYQLPPPLPGQASDYAHISQMPHGGYNVNLCFQLPGEASWQLGPEATREYLLGDIARRWPLIKRAYGLEDQGIAQLAPRIGFREGRRLKARYVLTENDYRLGNSGAHHPDCIALTDHAMDRHSPDGGCIEAENGPVGIPLRCLQPQELDNLLVTSRGAGFSSLTASAVRLQRTIMALGESAARAIADGRA